VEFFAGPAFGAACALLSAAAWAVNSLLVRTLSPPFTSVTINAVRATLGGAVLLVGVVAVGGTRAFAGVDSRVFVLLGISIVAASTIGDTVFFESARRLGVARAMTLTMVYPVIAAALAAIFFAERITVPVALGSLLVLAGLAVIVRVRERGEPAAERNYRAGLIAAGIAALGWAVSILALRPALGSVDAITAQAIRLPIAGAALWVTPWAWQAGGHLRLATRSTWIRLAALTVMTALSSVTFVASVKHAGVTVSAVLSSTAPLFALPLGALILGERITPSAIAGTIVTVIGIAVLYL
jgi:drug/metabolite transporter (DMT)-like permease